MKRRRPASCADWEQQRAAGALALRHSARPVSWRNSAFASSAACFTTDPLARATVAGLVRRARRVSRIRRCAVFLSAVRAFREDPADQTRSYAAFYKAMDDCRGTEGWAELSRRHHSPLRPLSSTATAVLSRAIQQQEEQKRFLGTVADLAVSAFRYRAPNAWRQHPN